MQRRQERMYRSLLIVVPVSLLFLLFSDRPSTAPEIVEEDEIHYVIGEVTRVDSIASTLQVQETVRRHSGTSHEFRIDPTTSLSIRERAIILAEVKEGDTVIVQYLVSGAASLHAREVRVLPDVDR